MYIRIEISGDKEVQARLKKLGSQLTKFQPEMNDIGSQLETYFSGQVFASQGGIIGSKWPRLSPAYAKWKAKHYPGRPPLVRTGKMIGGFRHTARDTSVDVTNRMPYFVYHQSSAARKKMPYRPMMGVNNDVKSIVQQILEKGIRRRIDGVTL